MIRIYKIREDRISEMKAGSRYMLIKLYLILYVVFVTASLLREDDNKFDTLIILTVGFVFLFLLSLTIFFFTKSPVYNTIIELTDLGIERSGEDLLTVKLKFTEIDRIIEKDNGTILLKKGIGSRIGLYFNQRAYIYEPGILFIPLAIDDYDHLLNNISQKMK